MTVQSFRLYLLFLKIGRRVLRHTRTGTYYSMPDIVPESMIQKAISDFEQFEFQNFQANPIGAAKH